MVNIEHQTLSTKMQIHVDSIKDIVDKTLDIEFKGKDSHVRFE